MTIIGTARREKQMTSAEVTNVEECSCQVARGSSNSKSELTLNGVSPSNPLLLRPPEALWYRHITTEDFVRQCHRRQQLRRGSPERRLFILSVGGRQPPRLRVLLKNPLVKVSLPFHYTTYDVPFGYCFIVEDTQPFIGSPVRMFHSIPWTSPLCPLRCRNAPAGWRRAI